LAVDLDGQGHLTVNLDILDAHERNTIYDVLINDLPIQDAVMNVAPGLDLIPANLGIDAGARYTGCRCQSDSG
jgi:chromosome partitioning protein